MYVSQGLGRALRRSKGGLTGDTTLTLGLELVKNPRVLEGTLSELSGFLGIVSKVCREDGGR